MITIDGSYGEGGGQILRTSLGLSLVTGKPFVIEHIRSNRSKTGLLRQHLTAVHAAKEISNAQIEGSAIGSDRLQFAPGTVKPGNYTFSVGTAGSATLVAQTVLPALLTATLPSEIAFEGGTHNPWAPPFDFLNKSFLPVVEKMGVRVSAEIENYGFYPAGGGRYSLKIEATNKLNPIDILERGPMMKKEARALVAKIPEKIAKGEIQIIRNSLKFINEECVSETVSSPGPGNVVMVEYDFENVTFLATAFGEKRKPLAKVSREVVDYTQKYLDSGAPVCEYLADQLLIPFALARGGTFRTVKPSMHTKTNIEMIQQFLDVSIDCEQVSEKIWEIRVGDRGGI